jgi:hypothetical protein
VPGVGFYRVRIAMAGEEAVVHRRELSLVVIESHHSPAGGEFGWSLPRGDRLLPLPLLGQWITQAGINWIKYPLWCSAQTPEAKVQETLSFVERLSFHGIETVGILDRLPEDSPSRAETGEPTSIADLVSLGREVWAPSLEATMTRLGTPIRWWQLGSDQDASFVGYPRLREKIAQVKAEMDRIGCDVNLGVGWGWMTPMPEAAGGKPPWRFLALGADPPLTSRELAVYLAAAKSPGLRRWVVLQPVARSSYSVSDRAIDLVQRMTAAKIAGAEGVFVPDPFGAEHGLLNEDGSPGELFLPWRTTALMLGGSESLGTLTLPGGSQNHVFARSGDAVMIAWRHKPLLESLPLGENTRQIDLWGRQLPVKKADDGLAVEVGPQPTFVTGLNKEVTRWQIGFRLLADRLPSVFGQRHRNGFDVKNSFPQGVEGTVTLVGPAGWNLQPQRVSFRLAVGETLRQPLDVLLPDNTGSGPHTLRADFEVVTDRSYRFSVYRPIHVGLGDVRIETATRLNEDGELEVQQRLVNDSNLRANFRCQLYAPDRRRMTTQVVVLGRGSDLKIYRLPDGKQLLGKDLWLRAEETDGPRVLNYRFTAGK